MTFRARLARLEQNALRRDRRRLTASEAIAAVLSDLDTLTRWLDGRGLTAAEALAAGATGPALQADGLSLAALAEIERGLELARGHDDAP